MKRKVINFLLVVLLLAGGIAFGYRQIRLRSVPAAVWDCLHAPHQVTLYSIHPEEPKSALVGKVHFHGYRILGQIPVSKAIDQQRIDQAIKQAVLHFPDPAACFNPRHGLRVSAGQNSYDLVICFECGSMEIYSGDTLIADTSIGGSPTVLNSILLEAGVPLDKD